MQNKMMTWTLVAFLALLLAIPASYAVKKAKNIDTSIPPDVLAGLGANVPVSHDRQGQSGSIEILTPGTRSTMYENAGSALLVPVRANISTFAEKDFQLVGEAPWTLLNTVAANINDPEIIRYVFNNKTVVNAFINRPDIQKLLGDSKALYNTASDESALAVFFGYANMRAALNNPKVIDIVANSMLMDAVLQTPSAQYFIKNPKTGNDVINKSPILTALKKDANISAALKKHPRTSAAAPTLLR
ncbi:MAG: hypothetical protein LBI01_02175 [Elusimicrobium sp.]|jgi:hypothetical protein|nr:hypothetical protein [Elusimicrobium sp.]